MPTKRQTVAIKVSSRIKNATQLKTIPTATTSDTFIAVFAGVVMTVLAGVITEVLAEVVIDKLGGVVCLSMLVDVEIIIGVLDGVNVDIFAALMTALRCAVPIPFEVFSC